MKNLFEKYKFIALVVLFLVCIVGAFFFGRSTIKITESVTYINGPTVSDGISGGEIPKPTEVIPIKPLLPVKPDTFWRDSIRKEIEYITLKVDTAKIISEFITSRTYRKVYEFPNSGTVTVRDSIQYNKLQGQYVSLTPVIKQVIQERKSLLTPFVSVGGNSFGYGYVGGGVFINNVGLEANYMKNFKPPNLLLSNERIDGFSVSLKLKFD